MDQLYRQLGLLVPVFRSDIRTKDSVPWMTCEGMTYTYFPVTHVRDRLVACPSDEPTGIACWMFSWGYHSPHVLANSSRCLHLALTVSFVGSPYHGIVRDGSSQGVSVPCTSSWEYRSPHVLARLRVPCIVRQRYRALDLLARVTPPARLFPLAGLVGVGFDLRVAG